MGLQELTPADIHELSNEMLNTLHDRIHAVARVSDEQALLATSHDLLEAEYATRGITHTTPLTPRVLTGVYLKDPHGRLIYDGKKTSIALNRIENAIVGDHLIVSKEDGVGLAYGWASIGPPQEITSDAFDALFDSHRVTVTEHKKWWGSDRLYLYPIAVFKPYPNPKQVDVPAGIQLAMDDVKFITDTKVASQDTQEEQPMPWKPSDADEHTKLATTDALRAQWAEVANSALAACLKDGGDQESCESSAIQQASAVVKKAASKDTIDPEPTKEVTEPEPEIPTQETLEAPSEAPGEPQVETKDDAETQAIVESVMAEIASTATQVTPQETVRDPEPDAKQVATLDTVDDTINDTMTDFAIDTLTEAVTELSDKAGRRVKRSMLDRLKEAFATLKEIIGWAEEPDSPVLPQLKSLPMVFKSLDGATDYFIIWPTNSYKDREREIFHAKAIHDFVNRMESADIKSVAEFWHLSQTKFGNIIWQDVVEDRFLVQIGVFDDTPVGNAFKAFFTKYPNGHPDIAPEGWGASHGYHYIDDDRKDGEYEWFHTNESSVLPRGYAANVFNPSPAVVTLGGKEMTKRDDALRAISEEVGVDLASIIATEARTYKDALDSTVEHKAKKEPVPDEEEELDEEGNPVKKDEMDDEKKPKDEKKDVETEPVADPAPEAAPEQPVITSELVKQIVEAFGKSYGMSELGDHIAQQNEMLAGLKSQLDIANAKIAELEKSTEEKVAESVAILPRFPWMQSFQSSTAKETEMGNDPRDLALKSSVPTSSPIAALTKNM